MPSLFWTLYTRGGNNQLFTKYEVWRSIITKMVIFMNSLIFFRDEGLIVEIQNYYTWQTIVPTINI